MYHRSEWTSPHYLQLIAGKTELIVFGSAAPLKLLFINGFVFALYFSPIGLHDTQMPS